MAAQPGSGLLIGGRYRISERLGAGGFGRVWKARDEMLDVDVAVKEVWLPPAISAEEQTDRLARAEREARNAARLRDHPGVVAVHDVVIQDGVPWMVMQLVHGNSLAEHLEAHGPLPVDRAVQLARSVLQALNAAHTAGIVHRDIKPANIMLATDGEVLLTDFGIAVHQADTALTATGAMIGSMEYIAPERARGDDGQAISDLFSLGVTLYQAVEGSSPFRRDTPTGSLTAVLFEQAPPPRRAGRLEPLITGLLEKDPARRTTIAQALAMIGPDGTATDRHTATLRPHGLAPTKVHHDVPAPAPALPKRHNARTVFTTGILVMILVCLAIFLLVPTSGLDQPGAEVASPTTASIPPAATTTRPTSATTTAVAVSLENPCEVVPKALLDRMRLTETNNHVYDDWGTLRCDWWMPGGGADATYGWVAVIFSPKPYQVRPGSRSIKVGGTITGHTYVPALEPENCYVVWPTSYGHAVVRMDSTSKTPKSGPLCKATEQFANDLLPHIRR